jgi:hypothetical protein
MKLSRHVEKKCPKEKSCKPKEKKCKHSYHHEEKKCKHSYHHEEKCDVSAEKNLLNLAYMEEGNTSSPDVSATYEIVIFNRSNNKITDLSIVDSLLGLQPNTGITGPYGGELRPYFTNIRSETCSNTLVLNSFDQIAATRGQLLGPGSFINPKSICSIIVRITGRGFLSAVDPESNQQVNTQKGSISMCIQNTAIISGSVTKSEHCGCTKKYSLFPLYVKSGEKQTNSVVFIGFAQPPQP